jgi:hypothetical protein
MIGRHDDRAVRAAAACGAALLASCLLAGCASVSPSPSATAIDLAPGGAVGLHGARTVWIGSAVLREGDPLAGRLDPHDAGAAAAATSLADDIVADLDGSLRAAVRKARRLDVVAARDRADLVLYFVVANRLHCWECRQPRDLWYWWGFVGDPEGRHLASLHGETEEGPDAAVRRFVAGVKSLRKRVRDGR